jgi:hypothetical protein
MEKHYEDVLLQFHARRFSSFHFNVNYFSKIITLMEDP